MGLRAFLDFDTPPSDAEVIDVEAQQWAFSFTYPNGAVSEGCICEVDRPVILQLHSADVLHALYIPAFRVQRNAVPGRTTEMWFKPDAARHVPRLLHAVLRQRPLADDHRGRGARRRRLLPPSWPSWPISSSIRPRRSRSPYAEVGQTALQEQRLRPVPLGRRLARHRADLAGALQERRAFSVPPPGYTLSAGDTTPSGTPTSASRSSIPARRSSRATRTSCRPMPPSSAARAYKDKKLTAIVEYIKSLDNHGPGGKPKYYRPMTTPATEPERARRRRTEHRKENNAAMTCNSHDAPIAWP